MRILITITAIICITVGRNQHLARWQRRKQHLALDSFFSYSDSALGVTEFVSQAPVKIKDRYYVTVNDFCKISQLERVIDRLLFFYWLNTQVKWKHSWQKTGNKRTEYLFTWYKPTLNVKTIFLAILYCVKMEGKSDFFPINYLCITRLYIKAPWCYEKYT